MLRKELGLAKPWSDNETFQRVYFCNVRREHDRVTRFIREMYSSRVSNTWFEFNIIFSRFINWPDTLSHIGYLENYEPSDLEGKLEQLATTGKIWGGAYVITTHGIPMAKSSYLARNVLGGVAGTMENALGPFWGALRPSGAACCKAAHIALQGLEGLGSFLAAQVVADLKNTPGHPLYDAFDKRTFVAHGPGSLRGLSWVLNGATVTPANFYYQFETLRSFVDQHWNQTLMGEPIDNQDLQNCLCEFDKFCRVSSGTGKSKRNYPGTG